MPPSSSSSSSSSGVSGSANCLTVEQLQLVSHLAQQPRPVYPPLEAVLGHAGYMHQQAAPLPPVRPQPSLRGSFSTVAVGSLAYQWSSVTFYDIVSNTRTLSQAWCAHHDSWFAESVRVKLKIISELSCIKHHYLKLDLFSANEISIIIYFFVLLRLCCVFSRFIFSSVLLIYVK